MRDGNMSIGRSPLLITVYMVHGIDGCKRIMDCEDVVRGGTIDMGRQQYGMMVGIYSAWWQSVIS